MDIKDPNENAKTVFARLAGWAAVATISFGAAEDIEAELAQLVADYNVVGNQIGMRVLRIEGLDAGDGKLGLRVVAQDYDDGREFGAICIAVPTAMLGGMQSTIH